MDNAEFVVAARTYLYLGEKGTIAPTGVGVPAAPWRNVGYTTPDNCQFATEPQFTDIMSAQSDFATGRIQTGDAAKLAMVLQQWNGPNFKAVYGGGAITEVTAGAGVFKFEPPAIGERKEVAALLRTVFGTKEYIIVVPKAFQGEGIPLDLNKTQEARLPLSLAVLGSDDVKPWYLLTNDPAFDPAAAGV